MTSRLDRGKRRPAGAGVRGRGKRVTRDDIARAVTHGLAELPCVHAVWEGGAVSHGTLDEWSDIDLCVDADDGAAATVFRTVERVLEDLSGIDQSFEMPFPPAHEYAQRFYRVRRASPFRVVDLAVFRHSAKEKFLEPRIHGEPVFLFARGRRPRARAWDARPMADRMRKRASRLEARHEMFSCFLEKEIRRGNTIEALFHYQRLILDTLLEVLRMRYAPRHFDFGVRYVHRELPARIIRRFERLAFVKDLADLRAKARTAERWLKAEFRAMDLEDVERDLTA